MNRAVAWNIKGVDFDAREAAQEAAHRSGQSLGEWLNTIIAERAEELGVEPREIDQQSRLDAVAARLQRMTGGQIHADRDHADHVASRHNPHVERPAARQERRPAPGRNASLDADLDDLRDRLASTRPDFAPAANQTALASRVRRVSAADISNLHGDSPRVSRDQEQLLNEAIEQFERRSKESQKKAINALSTVAQWIEINESRRETDRSAIDNVARKLEDIQKHVIGRDKHADNGARDALDKVARRLADIEEQVAQSVEDNQQQPVRLALARLENRLEAMAATPIAAPAVENTLRALDRKMDLMNAQIDAKVSNLAQTLTSRLSLQTADAASARPATEQPARLLDARPRAPLARQSAQDVIADITRRQRDLDDGAAAGTRPAMRIIARAPDAQATTTSALDQRLEAIAARLEQAASQSATAPAQQAPALNALQAEIAALSNRLEEMRNEGQRREERQTQLAARQPAAPKLEPQLAELRGQINTMANALDQLASGSAVLALENALHDLAARIETSRGAGAKENLIAPVEQLMRDLQTALAELDPRQTIEILHRELQSVHQKVEKIGARGIDAESFLQIQVQTSEIRELLAAAAARPLPVENIERQIAALSERIDRITSPAHMSGFGRTPKPDLAGLAADIRGMVDRALPHAAFETIEQRLADLDIKIAGAINQPQDTTQIADLSQSIANLHAKLAGSKDPSPEASNIADLSQRMGEMQRTLDAPRQASVDLAPFEAMLKDLSTKMEQSRPIAAESVSLQAIEVLLHDFTAKFDQRPALDQSLDALKALEPHLNHIVDKLANSDRGLTALASASSSQFEKLSNRIDDVQMAVAHQLETARAGQTNMPGLEVSGIVDMMRTLNEKIDVVRASSTSTQTLEAMLQGLAEKMDAARAPTATHDAIASLETQIQHIAGQLGETTDTHAALSSLEQTVNELLAQIEDGRFASLDAAEAAARTAARETLREAMKVQGSVTSPDMLRELDGLRALQQNTDQRTNSTLHLLHETLEKVVDRLASLEDDAFNKPEHALRQAGVPPVSVPVTRVAMASQQAGDGKLGLKAPALVAPTAAPLPRSAIGLPKVEPLFDDTALDDDDFLIEPGKAANKLSAVRHVSVPTDTLGEEGIGADGSNLEKNTQRSFIAAARRAAQAAAVESIASENVQTKARSGAAAMSARTGLVKSVQTYVQSRRKPLLLTLSAFILLFGAIRVFPMLIGHQEPAKAAVTAPIKQIDEATPSAPATNLDVAQPPAVPEPLDPPAAIAPAPSLAPGKSARTDMIDPAPVGSIPASGAMQLPPAITAAADGKLATMASAGNALAQYQLAMAIINGHDRTRDTSAAAQWLEKAAAKGLAPALYQLGALNEKGIGVKLDLAKARSLYGKAAAKGNVRAMYNLAVLIAEGTGGKPDYDNAAIWFKKAADRGVRDSQYNIGILCARGLGVKRDLVQSWAWFDIAAAQGDTGSTKNRDDVAKHLDSKQLAAARKIVADFRPLAADPAANIVVNPAPQKPESQNEG